MDVILLPHHNTVTSLQKLQHAQVNAAKKVSDSQFLPSYPLVSVLAHIDEREAEDSRIIETKMTALKNMMKGASGFISFEEPKITQASLGLSEAAETLIIPIIVPFMDMLEEAGFNPVEHPHILLGSFVSAVSSTPAECEVPAQSRSFRIALMQQTPLSESCPAAGSSWKYRNAFWVKLR